MRSGASTVKAGAALMAAPFLDDVHMHKRIHSSLGYLTFDISLSLTG
jgi:hypothetical protein